MEKKNIDETQVLFEERVGLCTITLCQDRRHPVGEKKQ